MKKLFLAYWIIFLLPFAGFSQKINYTDIAKEDSKDNSFEIIGKLKGNYLIYKATRSDDILSVYDRDMQLKQNVYLNFIPSKTIHISFFIYPDFIYVFYSYYKKGVVFCMGAPVDAEGKLIKDPVELDTAKIERTADKNVYSFITSEDKQKIMVYKILENNNSLTFATLVFDNQLHLINKSWQTLEYRENKNHLSDILLDNTGCLVFTNSFRPGSRDNTDRLTIVTKKVEANYFSVHTLDLKNTLLSDVKLKVDNANHHAIINSFYRDEQKGDIKGIYSAIWDLASDTVVSNTVIPFNNTIRAEAKDNGPEKLAFNNFIIKNIIVRKDGGYILTAEEYVTQESNLYNPMYRNGFAFGNPFYYNPFMYGPYSGMNNYQVVIINYNNILMLSISNSGQLEWNSVIQKKQSANDNDNYLSFLLFNPGSEIHFLYNDLSNKEISLLDNTLVPDGSIRQNTSIKAMNNNYRFMPKYGKQVAAHEVIIPCTYRNSISFAKIEY